MATKKVEMKPNVRLFLTETSEELAKAWAKNVEHLLSVNELDSPIEQLFFIGWRHALTLPAYSRLSHVFLVGQFPVEIPKEPRYRIDFAVAYFHPERRELKIGVECDSYQYHGENLTKEAFNDSIKRDRVLEVGDWKVFRFSGSEIVKNPTACAREVLDYIARLEPEVVPF